MKGIIWSLVADNILLREFARKRRREVVFEEVVHKAEKNKWL